MVTLIGFFFILGNVGLLVLFVPDLIGPVRVLLSSLLRCSKLARAYSPLPGTADVRSS